MIYKLDITFDPQEAIDYFESLKKDHSNMMWDHVRDHNDPNVIDPKNNMNGVYGWGLQTLFRDLDFPFHSDIDPHDEAPERYRNTKLICGFAEKLLNIFERPFRSFVMSFPPGSYIGPRYPSNPKHFDVIVPVIVNKDFELTLHSIPKQTTSNFEVGNLYMLDYDHKISQHNHGETEVVAIIVKVLYEYKDEILNMKVKL